MTFRHKSLLQESLLKYFQKRKELSVQSSPPLQYALETLSSLSVGGKLLRGSLFLEGLSDPLPVHLNIAMAIELVHSAFLIHDDIMDQSLERRGQPSLHVAWEQYKRSEKKEELRHYGLSQAISVGDLALFLAQSLLVEQAYSPSLLEILRYMQHIWSTVCLGQILDVDLGFASYEENVSVDDIFQVYEKKTAYYTFSLPLVVFALCEGRSVQEQEILSKIGRDLGILFQIRDDYLDIFGTPDQMKKYLGQDIKEKKKTLYLSLLYSSLSEEEQRRFRGLSETSLPMETADLEWVKSKMQQWEIEKQVKVYTKDLIQNVHNSLDDLKNQILVPILSQLLNNITEY